ncbi:hypothetical protein SAMN05216502_10445 [Citrobacter amalonaticus]|jgi:hypothetical protein|nr:hypothetical protein SAMN05216502_10445 [Citrobacter amalonaticus]
MKVVISNGIHASTAFALYNTFTSAVGSQRIDWLVLRSAMSCEFNGSMQRYP